MSRSHKKSHKRNNESSSLGKKKEKSKKKHKKHNNHKNEHRKYHSKKQNKRKKLSKREKEIIKKKLLIKRIYLIVAAFFLSLVIYISVFFFMFSIGKMDGYSMIPTLNNKEVVAVSRRKSVSRFDLIYMNTPNGKGKSVRRVIGIPGDEISFKDDELFINGNGKEEKYLIGKKKSVGSMILTDDFTLDEVTGQTKVPNDAYFVLGDNRKSSTDSRYYGFVSKKEVIGRVDLRIFPLSKFKVF